MAMREREIEEASGETLDVSKRGYKSLGFIVIIGAALISTGIGFC